MKIDIHTYSFGEITPVYAGYIDMEGFNADICCIYAIGQHGQKKNQRFYIQISVLVLTVSVLQIQKHKKSGLHYLLGG